MLKALKIKLGDAIDSISQNLTVLKERVQSSVKWAKYGWKDESWEPSYIIKSLAFKLEDIRKNLLKHSHHDRKSVIKTEQEIVKAQMSLAKVLNMDYDAIAYKEFRDKWGDIYKRIEGRDDNGRKTTKFWLDLSKIPKAKWKQAEREYKNIYKNAEKARYNDLMKAFKIIASKGERWWW